MSANNTLPPLPPLTSPDRHILQAQHIWLEENGLVPTIVCMSEHPNIDLPATITKQPTVDIYDPWYAGVGGIAKVNRPSVVLNISYRATRGLTFADTALVFGTRVGGKSYEFVIPYSSIMSIHGRGDARTGHFFPRRAFAVVKNEQEEQTVHMYPDEVLFGLNTEQASPAAVIEAPVKVRDRSHLSVVK
jgi:stringent starvation protein B